MPTKLFIPPVLGNAMLDQPDKEVFNSSDPDEVCSKVGQAFKPHRFTPVQHSAQTCSRLHQFSMGEVSMHRLKYGGRADVDPECLEDFYLIQMPMDGSAEILCGEKQVITHRQKGVILSPDQQLKMRYEDCDQLMLRIDRQELEQICSRHLGHRLRQPLEFAPEFDWQRSSSWLHTLEYLTQLQRNSPESLNQRLISHQLVELVINTLLTQQPSNYSTELNAPQARLAPRHVRRVEEYIEAHAEETLSPSRLAEIAGVSVRTLHAGFKDFRQMSPMEFLRSVRMQRVHNALMQQDNMHSVTETAMQWGFSHMGRFSQEYQRIFGEKPSETRRRAQT